MDALIRSLYDKTIYLVGVGQGGTTVGFRRGHGKRENNAFFGGQTYFCFYARFMYDMT